MRNILVPQVGHTPFVAALPFFMVTALAFFISFLERHFTQYASIISLHVFYFATVFISNPANIDVAGGIHKMQSSNNFQQWGGISYSHSSSNLIYVNGIGGNTQSILEIKFG
jgi:hypothetical protein